MDKLVNAAMKKWPNVPAIYYRLYLSARGQWHLFDVDHAKPSAATLVLSEKLTAFIQRNYAVDERGCWYFQNGPQRVYVQLAKAPYIAYLSASGQLYTHTDLHITTFESWWLNDLGELYVQCEHGPALIASSDVERVCAYLHSPSGANILDLLPEDDGGVLASTTLVWKTRPSDSSPSAPFCFTLDSKLPLRLGFIRQPSPTV